MHQLKNISKLFITTMEYAGLAIISISTLFAFEVEISSMIAAGTVTLANILLMFIYLEILAMVSIYLESGKLPVRMPLYIAMVALARYLILDMKELTVIELVGIGGTILVLALAVLVIRFGHKRYSYDEDIK